MVSYPSTADKHLEVSAMGGDAGFDGRPTESARPPTPYAAGSPGPERPGAILAEAGRLELMGEPAVLCTVVRAEGSCPRGLAARMIVRPDGRTLGTIGGGPLEAAVASRCLAGEAPSAPQLVEMDLGAAPGGCGGRMTVLLEPLGASPRLILFGAGHIAFELAAMARRLGYGTYVVDDRPEQNSEDRFPDATRVASFDPADWSALPLDRRALAVVVTRDHDLDLAVLRALIGRELGYLGMIGSRRKAAAAVAALEAEGVSRDRLAAVRCPVGLDIHAETPAEIAVSILAELVSVVRSEDPVGGPAEGRATGARP